MKECPECLAEHDANTDTCHFCNGAEKCSGHIRFLHGTLDQYGRERTETIACKEWATVYDKEGQAYYCKECWTKMCDGNPEEYEEFVYRLPELKEEQA